MKVLDVSNNKQIQDVLYYNREINQLYHPTGEFSQDSFDIVYSNDNLNTTKFIPILLKEWFYLVKKGGYLIIDYTPNKICGFQKLEENMWWLWKGQYEIVYHGNVADIDKYELTIAKLKQFIRKAAEPAKEEGNIKSLRFICKKQTITKNYQDSINKWTFGIITKGLRPEWINQLIFSIRQQNIPYTEIIICGTYVNNNELNIKYIPFNQRDKKGWISKKKNIIINIAKYENICIIHDRLVLDKYWFKEMKKWGNCFEFLTYPQTHNAYRINDWTVRHFTIYDLNKLVLSYASHIEYEDWYYNTIIQGQLAAFKKSIVLSNKLWFDESILKFATINGEDFLFSENMMKKGYIPRINPFSKATSLTNKELNPTFINFNSLSITPHTRYDDLIPIVKLTTYFIFRILYQFHIKIPKNFVHKIREFCYDKMIKLNPDKRIFYKEWTSSFEK